jgi:hypothetical protein
MLSELSGPVQARFQHNSKLQLTSREFYSNESIDPRLSEVFSYHEYTGLLKSHDAFGPSISMANHYESYDYEDRLKRLTKINPLVHTQHDYAYNLRGMLSEHSVLDKSASSQAAQARSYSYSVGGDLLEKENKVLSYDTTSKGVASISGTSFRYAFGDFGRLISGPGIDLLDWDAFGQLSSMELTNGLKKQFLYHPGDKERALEEIFDVSGADSAKLKSRRIFWNKYVILG